MALVLGVLLRLVQCLFFRPKRLGIISAKAALATASVGVADMIVRPRGGYALLRIALRGKVAELVAVHRVLADLRARAGAIDTPMPLAALALCAVTLTVPLPP